MRTYAQQKAALTRAKSKGYAAVLTECHRAVNEWNTGNWRAHNRTTDPCKPGAWPDDWARWQRALDDASPTNFGAPRIEDL